MRIDEFPEIESITGAPGVLASPFAAMHGLPSPLAAPYNGVAPGGGIAGLGGFSLGAGALGVRVPGSPQISSVLLVTNLNEEVSIPWSQCLPSKWQINESNSREAKKKILHSCQRSVYELYHFLEKVENELRKKIEVHCRIQYFQNSFIAD